MDPTNNLNNNWSNPLSSRWSTLAAQPASAVASTQQTSTSPSTKWCNYQAGRSSSSSWGSVASRTADVSGPIIPSNTSQNAPTALSVWGALAGDRTFKGGIQTAHFGQLSRSTLSAAAEGDGALTIKTHMQQMQVIEAALNGLESSVSNNTSIIIAAIRDFATEVRETNHQISSYCRAVIERGISNDPNFTPDDMVKARLMVEFYATALGAMKSTSESAIDLASQGGGIVHQQILGTIDATFQARTKQVALFAQNLEVFQKQEQHDLELILQVQNAKLKEQAQLFQQLKEIIHLLEQEKEGNARREMEERKAKLEEEIQLRGQWLKEEEAHNKHQLETAALEADSHQKLVALQNAKEIEGTVQAIKAEEQKAIAANQELEIREKAKAERQRIEAETRITSEENQLKASIQKKQIASTERIEKYRTTASIIRPPCVLQ
ncbi:hypothetical protein [Parachlamydia sp. AcF125]|uniref:hypothetical protein n=1 Tax=Parachlamydia sp. AcF125 TaxID=2795736 RepID=UPI001BCA0B91|nr:hypothetical protein [Parachlamydia sp. AcF125]MBS4167419.1 hypothetical protein [Parachlamydia sp. AcF125]